MEPQKAYITADEILQKVNSLFDQWQAFARKEEAGALEESHRAREKLDQLAAKRKNIESELIRNNETIANYTKQLSEEREKEELLNKELDYLKKRKEELSSTKLLLAKRNNDLSVTLRQKRDDVSLKTASVSEYKEIDEIEVQALVKYTQLEIVPIDDGHIRFVFKCIDKKNPEKAYWFEVKLSEEATYSVSKYEPDLLDTQSHVDLLNNDRDIFNFVKRMRLSYQQQVLHGQL